MSLDRLLDPDSIAVVGASNTTGKIGNLAMANARLFEGPAFPVNPNAETVLGTPAYDRIDEIEEPVDLALLCVPAGALSTVIDQCVDADVGGAVLYASGFAEHSTEGARRERELVERAADGNLTLLGPNTSGFINTHRGVYASFVSDLEEIPTGSVSVIAQSGGINHVVTFLAAADGIGIAKAIGLGNAANLGFTEVIEHLDADEATDAIALHVEGFSDGRAVMETCAAVETPVVMYKVGQADVSDFAASHTGAMVGDYDIYRAAAKSADVPMVDSCQALIDAGHLFAETPRPDGPNAAVVTGQAGPGIAIADRLQRAGLQLPTLEERTADIIADCLPGVTYTENPVDTGQPPDMETTDRLLRGIATDEAVDILVVYQLYEERVPYPVETLADIQQTDNIPVVFGTNGPESAVRAGLQRLREHGIAAFRSPERTADAATLFAERPALRSEVSSR